MAKKGKGKRIGYVDYQLENFHANTYLKIVREDLANRGFAVSGCVSMDHESGREWAKKNDVPYFESAKELNEHVDCYAVLAPGHPEAHLELCKMGCPFGKTTYVDKTFAPDLRTAKRIFALADKHGVAMQTSSALRYTNVQEYVGQVGRDHVRHMVAWGSGRSFGEYAIHPVELMVSCMGAKAQSLMRRGSGAESQLLVNYAGGRTGVVNVYVNSNTPFAASVTTEQETKLITVDGGRIFVDMAAAILDLFESGKPNIDRSESLMIRKILDAAEDSKAAKGFVRI